MAPHRGESADIYIYIYIYIWVHDVPGPLCTNSSNMVEIKIVWLCGFGKPVYRLMFLYLCYDLFVFHDLGLIGANSVFSLSLFIYIYGYIYIHMVYVVCTSKATGSHVCRTM